MSDKDYELNDILNEFQDDAPAAPAEESAPRRRPSPAPQPRQEEPAPTLRYAARRQAEERNDADLGPRLRELGGRLGDGAGKAAVIAAQGLGKAADAASLGFGKAAEGAKRLGSRLRQLREEHEAGNSPAWLPRVITGALLLLSLLCVLWVLNNVHPGSGTVVRGKPRIDLAARISPDEVAAEPNEAGEPVPVKKHYAIDENAVVAPAPNPACFGTISIEEPQKVQEIIRQARDYGLLREDETVAFDPNVNFYYDEQIEYYLDETILVICWKEVIDGNTCSFVEIKVADASQFRRKFADDTFASASQYYSTEMHKSTNAVVTLNADFYQNRDFGVVVYNRKLYRFPTSTYTGSYKKYNCLETCYVNDQGDFLFTELGQPFTQEELEQYIADNNILFSISFGPILVRDGQVRQCDWYPVGEIDKGYSRAGIGQVDKLHYLYMSLNHSPEKEARWTVNEFARHFGEKPVINAYCLDGGQTGEIVFQGRAYNHVDVVNGQKERPVSDNIYFATAIGGMEVSG